MQIVHTSAAHQTKFRDTKTALVRGRQWPDVRPTAERWLAQPVARAEHAYAQKETTVLTWMETVGLVAVGLTLLFDNIFLTREFYFTAGGRRRADPMMKLLFPTGTSALRKLPPSVVLEKVGQLADRLETTAHPKVTRERAKEEADKLRAICAELAPKVQALAAATLAKAAADAAFASAADVCRLELASFKRALQAEKMREAAIHEIIPGYSGARRIKADPVTLPSGGTTTPTDGSALGLPAPTETPTPTA